MKKIILAAIAIALLVFNVSSKAQNSKDKKDKKDKKVSVTIVTEDNGKKTVIDTSFDAKDDAAIEKFLKAHDVDRPLPPIPPSPPAPPSPPGAPAPPAPPSPPDADDEHYSFHFDFDEMKDQLNDQMDQLKEQLDQAKESIKQSLKEAKISKEEMEKLRDEINKELDKIDINVDDDKTHKRIIIHKKTGDVDNDNDMQWNTNAFVDGNGKVVKCIVKDGDKTNCRMMVISGDEVSGDEVKHKINEDKDPDASSAEKKTTPDNNQLNPDDFKVYPNPNTGSFDLSFHLDTHGKTNISLVDASGKEVFSESFTDFTGDYNKHIDLHTEGKGTYLLNVKQDDKWMHKKVVIK